MINRLDNVCYLIGEASFRANDAQEALGKLVGMFMMAVDFSDTESIREFLNEATSIYNDLYWVIEHTSDAQVVTEQVQEYYTA